ncbi:hypothetical protein B9G69_004500 [Bdellovibrio sp. SKB1291214]|uniref:hypothetical protein n=1 Tax=Bdellovibrio sp. SKB1291214 TaxID=1732569 RepID=UPI000B519E9B|nr:hypothetical protein [Bdellovibrio sp. SKB1291214]UYL09835.1 hypothetical protein B9G69_004500 [Bdellovibrio sp. SKB1291214]
MKTLVLAVITAAPLFAWAQVQSQQQCVTTLRARSLSLSSADAEKLCAGDYPEVANCAITAKQTSMGSMEDALKKCRMQWGTTGKDVTPKESPKEVPKDAAKLPVQVPVDQMAPSTDKSPTGESKDAKKAQGFFEEL